LNIPTPYLERFKNLKLNKEQKHFTKVLFHFGQDKFHTQLLNLSPLNGSSRIFMTIFSLRENKITPKQLN
jgi:hypothetical protein